MVRREAISCLIAVDSRQSSLLDQFVEQLAMMQNLIVAPGLRVVVSQTIHTMRAVGHDSPDFSPRKSFDILPGQLLEK